MDNAVTLDVQLKRILEKLKPSTEKYVQDQICALPDVDSSVRESFVEMVKLVNNRYSDQVLRDLLLSGSVVEGAMMARCFQNNEDWNEIEIDIMFNEFTISQEVSHLLEPVENKLGFVRLPFCKELWPDFYTT